MCLTYSRKRTRENMTIIFRKKANITFVVKSRNLSEYEILPALHYKLILDLLFNVFLLPYLYINSRASWDLILTSIIFF